MDKKISAAEEQVTSQKIARTTRLFLSFWAVCLDNLPQGRFERRALPAAVARKFIGVAREDNSLTCVSRDDLFAPYRQREHRNHNALCKVLQKTFDIALCIDDFAMTCGEKDGVTQIINPLTLARLQPGDCLLVVTCDYAFDASSKSDDVHDLLTIAEDTVRFVMIEALGGGESDDTA